MNHQLQARLSPRHQLHGTRSAGQSLIVDAGELHHCWILGVGWHFGGRCESKDKATQSRQMHIRTHQHKKVVAPHTNSPSAPTAATIFHVVHCLPSGSWQDFWFGTGVVSTWDRFNRYIMLLYSYLSATTMWL